MRHDTASIRSSVPSGPPPSYARHDNDELLTPSLYPSLHGVRRPPARRYSISRLNSHPTVTQLLTVLTSNEALNLTIDNGLIYPPPPSNALYHLPRVLTWSGNEVFLSRSLPALARGNNASAARDLALYTMRRTPFTHEIALIPRREGLKAATMRGKRNLLGGMSWEVESKNQIVLKYSKGKWKDGSGKVLATERVNPQAEGRDTEEGGNSSLHARDELTIAEGELDIATKDLIVAAWCSRIWQTKQKVSLARTLIRGQGTSSGQGSPLRASIGMPC